MGTHPIHHRLAGWVYAHLLLRMLAYHIEHHLCNALAPLLFTDEELVSNDNSTELAECSVSAKRREHTKVCLP